MADFLTMGGYGFFVWPSYVVSMAVLVLIGVLAYRFLRAQEETLKEMEEDISRKADQ